MGEQGRQIRRPGFPYPHRMFRRKRKPDSTAPSSGPGLREMALRVSPDELGLKPEAARVWGVIMDSVFPDGGWYSLVVFADGTTSLYTNGTFGVIGAGSHPEVRTESDSLLAVADQELGAFQDIGDTSLPPPDHVAIRVLTFDGPRLVIAEEDELGYGRHAASVVFHAAHAVITAVRQATESATES